jgi:hypothetical protein
MKRTAPQTDAHARLGHVGSLGTLRATAAAGVRILSGVDVRAIAARGEAMVELVRLAEREAEAQARIGEVGREARAAAQEMQDAREALIELERKPDGVSMAQRRKVEARLALAEERAAKRWPERRAGAERAARDAHHALQRHAAEHRDELVAELEENGRDAAEAVDRAAEAFLRAVERRTEAERALIEVVALTRAMSPNDVARSRADQARTAVAELLQRGGEAAPVLKIDLPVAAA